MILTPKQRIVMRMSLRDDLNQTQIARSLGLSRVNINRIVARARERFRQYNITPERLFDNPELMDLIIGPLKRN